jgi:CheY-like chemotaxis protein
VDDVAKLIAALASLAWPVVLAVLLFKLYGPIKSLVKSARGRGFTIKVAGNELTMEEVSEQQRVIVSDLQNKVAELEKRAFNAPADQGASIERPAPLRSTSRILWVDDEPRNNSLLAAALEERGTRVEIALSTDEALKKFTKQSFDAVISDMGRPEGDKAGLDLTRAIKALSPDTPVFIYCGSWGARMLRKEALDAGVAEITASASTLLAALPVGHPA